MMSDKECEYSETFALFLTSKLANPHYSPEIFAQLTVINFTVTMGGLEQQLLGRALFTGTFTFTPKPKRAQP